MRILLVEDNVELAKATVERLHLNGHAVDHAANLSGANELSRIASYDLVLLDIMLPDGDGRAFLRAFRARKDNTPVIVVTARSQVSDRVSILDLGADDYIVKPFDFDELEARIRAILRRKSGSRSNEVILGDIRFDRLSGTLKSEEDEIELRNRELRLLEIFVDSTNVILSKAQLVDHLFSFDEEVSENAIEVYVARLRKHLGDNRVTIRTVRGVGYKLEIEDA
ncbi:MAG: response regulator transcription factor [Pseudomonadota bacterium]